MTAYRISRGEEMRLGGLMQFTVLEGCFAQPQPQPQPDAPGAFLVRDTWDDYTFRTMFLLWCSDGSRQVTERRDYVGWSDTDAVGLGCLRGRMSTPEYELWNERAVRRPDDVRMISGGRVPLSWQMAKRVGHVDRLMNRTLPADFPGPVERGGAGDVLAVLALSESIRRGLAARRAGDIREAILLGATWSEVAAAIDTTPDEARAVLRDWTERQHDLYQIGAEPGEAQRLVAEEGRHAAVLALIELADDQRAEAGTHG
ncbi:hypothetical protein [Streptomyces sp. NPDC002853]